MSHRTVHSGFDELARVQIEDNKHLVISKRRDDGDLSIVQEVTAIVGQERYTMFLKNAIKLSPDKVDPVIDALQQAKERLNDGRDTKSNG